MTQKNQKTNDELIQLVTDLKILAIKQKSKFWKRIALEVGRPRRTQRKINLYELSKVTKPNETIIVPGKVLGTGTLDHNLNITALNFSESASDKIKNKTTIRELMQKNPKGNKVRIIC
jgi:large subunit ribosomal protein L18e